MRNCSFKKNMYNITLNPILDSIFGLICMSDQGFQESLQTPDRQPACGPICCISHGTVSHINKSFIPFAVPAGLSGGSFSTDFLCLTLDLFPYLSSAFLPFIHLQFFTISHCTYLLIRYVSLFLCFFSLVLGLISQLLGKYD